MLLVVLLPSLLTEQEMMCVYLGGSAQISGVSECKGDSSTWKK